MNSAWTERALWTTTVVSVVFAVYGARSSRTSHVPLSALGTFPRLDLRTPSSDSLLDAVGVARELDLFRPGRSPVDSAAIAPASGVMTGALGGGTLPTSRPQLILRGLVGGPSLDAVVEGLPGVQGAAVLRAGETVAGITLRAVRRDTAILVGRDTTWKLTVRRF